MKLVNWVLKRGVRLWEREVGEFWWDGGGWEKESRGGEIWEYSRSQKNEGGGDLLMKRKCALFPNSHSNLEDRSV